MNIESLPKGSAPQALSFPHFPTRLQATVWRNWELVPPKRLAEVIGAKETDVLALAEEMGLPVPPEVESRWLSRGYVTLIKANWHLLPYEQLLKLLGWTPEKLAFHLKEDDFLFHKLGDLKPSAEPVEFRPLTEEERRKTAELKASLRKNISDFKFRERPFGFLDKPLLPSLASSAAGAGAFKSKFIYSYSAVYGDALLDDVCNPFPDSALKSYADAGVDGVWLQAVLYSLFPLDRELSQGWETRLENLRKLVKRAKKFGLGVYLYLNEPRGMPEEFFASRPTWKGARQKGTGHFALCVSENATLEYLSEACAHVFRSAPGLAGVFTITMSENITHCKSRGDVEAPCPRCAKTPPQELIAKVNGAIAKGARSASPSARIIAWDWCWDAKWASEAVGLLPEGTELMCVSECEKPLEIGGVRNVIRDYSISQPGPSERSVSLWSEARRRGLKTVAKVQLNNSWECSALPYIPVPFLVKEHLDNLKAAKVDGLMLSWTLGGYPGGNLELLDKTPEQIAAERFGDSAPRVVEAWRIFSEAFRNFPFSVGVLYLAPQNAGPANLLFLEKTGYKSTMVGYPYDDLESWRANYPADVFESQFKALAEGWAEGVAVLDACPALEEPAQRESFESLKRVATAAGCHFRSAWLQIRFVRLRGEAKATDELKRILREEISLAKTLHGLALEDSTIGFEASNHYAYTVNDLREKVVCCERLLQKLD